LTFGDMAGAIVGKRCGWLAYSIGGNHKSVEGSLAVFVVSFAWIAGTILALTDIRGADVAAGSLSVALAAVVLEAVSRRGLDNLLLPVGVAALVLAWHKPATPIATRHALEFTGAILAFTSAFAAAIAIVRVRARSPFRATE
jgi:phytol kinase